MKKYRSLESIISNMITESTQVHSVFMNNGERYVHHGTYATQHEADEEAENLHFYKLNTKVVKHDNLLTRLAQKDPDKFLKNIRRRLSEEEELDLALQEAFKDYDFSKNVILHENLLLDLYQKYKDNKNKKHFAVFYNNTAYDDGEFQSEGQWKYHSHHVNLSDANAAKRTLGEFKSSDSPMNIRIIDLTHDQLAIAKKKPHALMMHFEKQLRGGNEEDSKPLTAKESFQEWHRVHKEKLAPQPTGEHGHYNDYVDWSRRERHQYLQKPQFKSELEKLGLLLPQSKAPEQKLTKHEMIKTKFTSGFDPKDPYKTIKRYDK